MSRRREFTSGPSRVGRLATGLGALAVLTGLTVGLPALLRHATTVMLPHGWTPLAELPDALTSPDDGDLFVQAVIGAGWCTWAVFTLLVTLETGRRLLGRQPHTRATLRTPHGLTGLLVAAVAALATSPVSSAHAAALPAVAADSDPLPDDDQTPPVGPPAQPSYVLHLVERGQGLLDLEEMYGVPWQRIAEANYTVEQPDGGRLEPGRTVIHAGWQLRIPTTPATPVAHTIDQPDKADQPDERPEYEVAPGDWMWHIAGRYLGDEERYLEIADLNPQLVDRYGDDFPDHIQPGDELVLPADAHDHGERRHATGALLTTAPPPEPEPAPPPEPVEPPQPRTPPPEPATPSPEPTGAPSPAPASPTPTPSSSATGSPTPGPPTHPSDDPAAGSDGPADPQDDDSGPNALAPIAFGAALIAATLAVAAAIKLRRRGAAGDPRVGRRGHRRGHRPHHVDNGTVEQRLHAAAQPLDVDRLDTALRALATGLARRPSRLPDIIGAHVVDGDVHLLLTSVDEQPPPPWQANGTRWTLIGDHDLPSPPGGTLAALPTLATVGSQARHPGAPTGGEHLLLDLERLGCLSITGDPGAGRDLLRYLASELAMNSWADDVEVICVGWPPEQAQLLAALNPDRVHAAEPVAEQMAQLRQRVRLAVGTLAGAGAADALAGRAHDLAGDSWMPIVALVYDPQPGDLDAVADLADELRQVGRCAVAVATTGAIPTRDGQPEAVHTITVTADRAVRIPFLDTTLAAVGLPVPELEQLARVITAARDGAEEPVPPAPEPEPWTVGTDAAGALLPAPEDAPVPVIDEYAEEQEPDTSGEVGLLDALGLVDADQPPALAGEPDQAAGEPHGPVAPAGAVTIGEEPVPPPPAPAPARAEADPTLDADLAAWYQPTPDRPRIRVLGPVIKPTEVIDAPGQPPQPGRLLLLAEVLVYLAQCGRRGASTAQLDADLWPGQEVQVSYRRATLSRARAWAGKRADGTPWLAEFHYKLEEGYLLDWHLFRRLRAWGQSLGPDGAADLRAALELVRGMPLAEFERIAPTTRSPYSWLPTSDVDPDHLAAAIVDTATELAELYLAAGDTTGARWAVDKAWLVDPDRNYDQPWQILLRIHAAAGHLAELEACVHELMRLREAEVEEDLDPAIYTLLQEVLPAGYWDRTREPAYQD